MSAQIPLTQGYVALVDEEDLPRLTQWSWCATVKGKHVKRVYAVRGERVWRDGKPRTRHRHMHREILCAPAGLDVDHINGNCLDNRKANLRLCTRSQNLANSRQAVGATGYRGVTVAVRASRPRYKAQLSTKSLGLFDTPEEAARAYDAAAAALFGPFAKLNFPRDAS